MTNDFVAEVRAIVEPLLVDLGFVADGFDDFDEGGIPGTVVYYRSSDCKIQVYKSSRQGSINCTIAPLRANNEFCHRDPSSEWQFITKFTPTPYVPLEELVKSVSYESLPDNELLEEIRDRIAKYYNDAHAGILKMYGNG